MTRLPRRYSEIDTYPNSNSGQVDSNDPRQQAGTGNGKPKKPPRQSLKVRIKRELAEGDKIVYALLSITISTAFFFFLRNRSNLTLRDMRLVELFTFPFWDVFLQVFWYCVLSDLLGSVLAYILVKLIYIKPTRRWTEYERVNLRTFVVYLISATFRCIAAIADLYEFFSGEWFGDGSVQNLVLTYLILKVVFYIIARLVAGRII